MARIVHARNPRRDRRKPVDMYSDHHLDNIAVEEGIPDDLWSVYHKRLISKEKRIGRFGRCYGAGDAEMALSSL